MRTPSGNQKCRLSSGEFRHEGEERKGTKALKQGGGSERKERYKRGRKRLTGSGVNLNKPAVKLQKSNRLLSERYMEVAKGG